MKSKFLSHHGKYSDMMALSLRFTFCEGSAQHGREDSCAATCQRDWRWGRCDRHDCLLCAEQCGGGRAPGGHLYAARVDDAWLLGLS